MTPKYANEVVGTLPEPGINALADAIREAVGAGPDARVIVRTPQFARPAHWPAPGGPPSTREGWEALREMSCDALAEMGLESWDGRLMLFPGEWYAKIPEGLRVESINGRERAWCGHGVGRCDDDVRFGCLAWGIPARIEEDRR